MDSHIPKDRVSLRSHPAARDCAIAASAFVEGSTIVVVPSLANVLLFPEKGHRCDHCFRTSEGQSKLRRCTGCAGFWYCSTECQTLQWKQHKKICKNYLWYISSPSFVVLEQHEKHDALLLVYLLAQEQAPSSDDNSPLSAFLSLLPGPSTNDEFKIPLPPSMRFSTSLEHAKSLYSRCGNNNFAIHSHLTTIGHGVFPLASRLFNHSCYPNAAPKYKFTPTGVVMEVVALREIAQDEEICIPYLDPAMLQTRQQIFRYTYGFKCRCPSCVELEGFDVISPPSNSGEIGVVASLLKAFVGVDKPFVTLPTKPRGTIPSNLHCIFHEAYLSQLSESFSKASHGSQYDTAVEAGVTLLAAYILIYPPNYPQIGVHLLELAKTSWNKFVSSEIQDPEGAFGAKQQARMFLNAGHQILRIYGEEGDKEGPLSETATLWSHLESQLIPS